MRYSNIIIAIIGPFVWTKCHCFLLEASFRIVSLMSRIAIVIQPRCKFFFLLGLLMYLTVYLLNNLISYVFCLFLLQVIFPFLDNFFSWYFFSMTVEYYLRLTLISYANKGGPAEWDSWFQSGVTRMLPLMVSSLINFPLQTTLYGYKKTYKWKEKINEMKLKLWLE